jgi:hypothetical protein
MRKLRKKESGLSGKQVFVLSAPRVILVSDTGDMETTLVCLNRGFKGHDYRPYAEGNPGVPIMVLRLLPASPWGFVIRALCKNTNLMSGRHVRHEAAKNAPASDLEHF